MRRHLATVGLLLAAFGAVAACSSTPDPVFDNEGGQEVTCMAHQTAEPGARYLDLEMRDTADVFAVLRYYTANGTKPYCDNAPATDADRAWAEFYADQVGSPDRVSAILD